MTLPYLSLPSQLRFRLSELLLSLYRFLPNFELNIDQVFKNFLQIIIISQDLTYFPVAFIYNLISAVT